MILNEQGFEKLLKRLSKTSSKIKLITPGRIYRTSSNHQGTLELRITNHMKDTSSFKLLAVRFASLFYFCLCFPFRPDDDLSFARFQRKQSLVQELFIVSNEDISSTSLLQSHLQREIGTFCCISKCALFT